jgi:CheY-like chemotaxis protein
MTPSSAQAPFERHQASALPRRRGSPAARPLVLVVEDDPDTRLLYAQCLELLGHRTATEASGERGVEAALRMRPDAILMDIAMPGFGGIEATRRIKADARTRACLVIAVTGHGTSMFAEARRGGCDAYFRKPFNAFALDSVLRVLATAYSRPAPAAPSAIVKRCDCERQYTHGEWSALPLGGRMHAQQGTVVIELRKCVCGSSIVLPT